MASFIREDVMPQSSWDEKVSRAANGDVEDELLGGDKWWVSLEVLSMHGIKHKHKRRFDKRVSDTAPRIIHDTVGQKLRWVKPPRRVLIVHKINDVGVVNSFIQLTKWLIEFKPKNGVQQEGTSNGLTVVVEEKACAELPEALRSRVQTFCFEKDDLTGQIDIIMCLGGDGTLLYASSLFQGYIPPIMAFHLGSLGFLSPFEFDTFEKSIPPVFQGQPSVILRSRIKCILAKQGSACSIANRISAPVACQGEMVKQAINEVVIDRGVGAFITNLDLFIDDHYVTSVQGDGLIISTPTGSTAYAMACGASMIHPNVPGMLIVPINAHSLSFRPIVVPAGVEIKVALSPRARNTAWVSIDGRSRQELGYGDSVRITTSPFPMPSVCRNDQVCDWFSGLAECLHWNVRKEQKSFESNSSSSASSGIGSRGNDCAIMKDLTQVDLTTEQL